MQEAQILLPTGSVVNDRYKIEELLGKGGFGAVYLVRDLRVQGNRFALKEVIDPSAQERKHFAVECELLQRLDHPALPRFYRVFEDAPHNRVYLLMDYVAGPNLDVFRQRQEEKRFSILEALRLIAPIIDAVSYLHHCTPPIIHRDIKPSNIIVAPSGEDAMLVDFGIAKEYSEESTTTAVRRLSPNYSAPEQYTKGTDMRTDIYGLAATLYAMLSGNTPIDALQRLIQTRTRESDPLEPLAICAPGIPTDVSDVINKALSLRVEDRYDSVQAFWQALQSAVPTAVGAIPETPFAPSVGKKAPVISLKAPDEESLASMPVMSTTSYARGGGNARLVSAQNGRNAVRDTPRPAPLTRKRRGLLPLVVAVLLLAILGSVAFASGLVPLPWLAHTPGSQPGHTTPTTHVTATAHATKSAPTATPKATATPVPTMKPTRPPVKPQGVPALLGNSYSGTIHNQPANQNGDLILTNVKQNGGSFSGTWTLTNGFSGRSDFTGSISADRSLRFIVVQDPRFLPLLFTGQVNGDGSLSGSYCSESNNACDPGSGQGYGTWNARPTSPTPSSAQPGS